MTGQAGYTLVETMAALSVLALSAVGLSAGLQLLLKQQAGVNALAGRTQSVRTAQRTLTAILNREGPYRAQEPAHLSGDAQSLRVDCGEPRDCVVAVAQQGPASLLSLNADGIALAWRVPSSGRVAFAYQGTLDTGPVWPPASGRRQALRSIALMDESETGTTTLLKIRIWAEEPATCAFDPVLADCR